MSVSCIAGRPVWPSNVFENCFFINGTTFRNRPESWALFSIMLSYFNYSTAAALLVNQPSSNDATMFDSVEDWSMGFVPRKWIVPEATNQPRADHTNVCLGPAHQSNNEYASFGHTIAMNVHEYVSYILPSPDIFNPHKHTHTFHLASPQQHTRAKSIIARRRQWKTEWMEPAPVHSTNIPHTSKHECKIAVHLIGLRIHIKRYNSGHSGLASLRRHCINIPPVEPFVRRSHLIAFRFAWTIHLAAIESTSSESCSGTDCLTFSNPD